MKGSGEFWVAVGNEIEGPGQIVLDYGRVEVGQPKGAGIGLEDSPSQVEADDQPAEHPKDPEAIGAAQRGSGHH
jgi:hypothetical protein